MGNPAYTNVAAELASDPVTELALDLSWAWNHATDELWRELEPELWEVTQNPWLVMQSVSHDKLQQVLSSPSFRERVGALLESKRETDRSVAWFQKTHCDASLTTVAYFSMEYMLSEALPIYSGGLGNVAGDQLKAASDLGVPVIGVGLLYQQGYFRQEIDPSGSQVARYPFNDPGQLPIRPLRDPNGDWLRLKVFLPGYTVWIRAWEAKVGRTRLFLLDTNDPANQPAYRSITSELYGGGPELRLRQEAVLGMGGWRLLRALGIRPEVCHLNEGHAAFAVLERAVSFMEDHGQPFEVALAVTRSGNLFTTHTPVEAGFDRFSPELVEKYLKVYAERRLKISLRNLLALGRQNPNDNSEPFNMAYLAIRGSGAINGVSRLHGVVSRRLFRSLFPRWPEAEVPIGHVTNGVHVPTWDSAEADALWTRACTQHRWRQPTECMEEQIRLVDDQELWDLRFAGRRCLVEFTRRRLAQQRAYQGALQQDIDEARLVFDETWLTLGFARRFATYKRPNMLLHDWQRLVRLLTHPERPVQLVIAGKAHPQDGVGQSMIKQWNEFTRLPEVRRHIVFLADYDMLMTQELAEGVDVWLNTPRRPWEASGTSGMKVLVNGGLNLSELDGWWAEAYAPEVGWAIGDGQDRGDDPSWDAAEADALYTLLEQQIVPCFYDRDQQGIPRYWVAKMRESMCRLTPAFSANRSVRQYTEEHYLPLASAYLSRAADGGRAIATVLGWQHEITSVWQELHFTSVTIDRSNSEYLFTVQVYLGRIRPEKVEVEIYAESSVSQRPFREPMALDHAVPGTPGFYQYTGRVPGDRPADHYTPRVVPRSQAISVPLEMSLITWQK
jgi:starch phosphorylase